MPWNSDKSYKQKQIYENNAGNNQWLQQDSRTLFQIPLGHW